MSRTLIFGGARSGKSAYAERRALASGKQVMYLATAAAGDAEMAQRIGLHRQQRPAAWPTLEEPLALGAALRTWCQPGRLILIDCLTLWLSNVMFSSAEQYPDVGAITLPPLFDVERADFLQALTDVEGDVIMVSNEVGMGIVPNGAISRRFTDEAGRLNQAVAARCEHVMLVAAGLPLVLKGAPCSPA